MIPPLLFDPQRIVAEFRRLVYESYRKAGFKPIYDVEKRVPDNACEANRPFQCMARPFTWDRPGEGLYDKGQIRVLWRDKSGNIEYCRTATDEEVRFIMMFEQMEELVKKHVASYYS